MFIVRASFQGGIWVLPFLPHKPLLNLNNNLLPPVYARPLVNTPTQEQK